jgi:hypothetical protein
MGEFQNLNKKISTISNIIYQSLTAPRKDKGQIIKIIRLTILSYTWPSSLYNRNCYNY